MYIHTLLSFASDDNINNQLQTIYYQTYHKIKLKHNGFYKKFVVIDIVECKKTIII